MYEWREIDDQLWLRCLSCGECERWTELSHQKDHYQGRLGICETFFEAHLDKDWDATICPAFDARGEDE